MDLLSYLQMCTIHELVDRKSEYQTLIKRGATLGANSTIVCGSILGEFSFIGAGAVVTRDVPNYALMVGVPAKQIGWMSEFGERLQLAVSDEGEAKCPKTNVNYTFRNGELFRKF